MTGADVAQIVNAFGVGLYAHVAPDAGDNVVLSPASIAIALAMARAGAAGQTADEMDAVLHAGGQLPAIGMLAHELTTRRTGRIELSIANSLWLQKGFPLHRGFVDAVAEMHAGELRSADYRADAEGARARINRWARHETRGRIPSLIAPNTISAITRLVLVNAIYLKAPWMAPFSEAATRPGPFTTTRGATVDAPAMHRTGTLAYCAGDGWQAIALPYEGRQLSMVIVLPRQGAAVGAAVQVAAEPPPFDHALVALALPKFDIAMGAELRGALSEMGMPAAFDEETADFSAAASVPGEPLFIGAVVHQANITVDEQGTEAAAATAVVQAAGAAMPVGEPIPFVVDRPFAFAVRDNATGAVLFLGHVGDPLQRRQG